MKSTVLHAQFAPQTAARRKKDNRIKQIIGGVCDEFKSFRPRKENGVLTVGDDVADVPKNGMNRYAKKSTTST